MRTSAQTAAAPQTAITITFGTEHAISYVMGVTSAPVEYDGFGTLTLDDTGEGRDRSRFVLIQAQHERWQSERYRSGLFGYEPSNLIDAEEVGERLYRAMIKGFAQGIV